MADHDFILAPSTVRADFSVAAVKNIFCSLYLLNQADELSGFSDWVRQTYAALTPERLRKHRLFTTVLTHGLMDEKDIATFPEYLEKMSAVDPALRLNLLLDELTSKFEKPDYERIVNDQNYFLGLVEQHIAPHYAKKGAEFDITLFKDAHALFQNPQDLNDYTHEHLNFMWEHHLRDEWNKALPTIEESVNAFGQIDFSGQTTLEVTRNVTGRDLSGAWAQLEMAEYVTFIPSMHIGPYVFPYFDGSTHMHLVFGARIPRGVAVQSAILGRSELLVRLNALADDTRLAILELLTENDEMCAQDIMNMLNLSQSSASRHLRQLTATGFLTERRREVAKCYSLQSDRVEDTLTGLKKFLKPAK